MDAQPRISKLPSPAHASGVAPVRAPCPRPSSTPRARGCAQRRLTARSARHHPPRPTGHGTGEPSRRRFPRPGRHRITEARPLVSGQDPRGFPPHGPFPDGPVQRRCRRSPCRKFAMANKMLIDAAHPEETRVVTVKGSKVEEFDFESASRRQLRGNIYLAKVTRVEPSLQAAFVEYGGNRHGFLAFSEIHPDYYQIPIADRMALLEEEARAEREHEERPERQERSERGERSERSERSDQPRRRRRRGRRAEASSRPADAVVSAPVQDSQESAGQEGAAQETGAEATGWQDAHPQETLAQETFAQETPRERPRAGRSRAGERHPGGSATGRCRGRGRRASGAGNRLRRCDRAARSVRRRPGSRSRRCRRAGQCGSCLARAGRRAAPAAARRRDRPGCRARPDPRSRHRSPPPCRRSPPPSRR